MIYDAIIIGAGACGMMCGVQAGYLNKKVLLLEKNDRPGAKILISGGGRCNYTNLYTAPKNFLSKNEHFCKAALSQWTVQDTIDFFESNGISGHEKTLGQLFPISNKAKDVVGVFIKLLQQLTQPLYLDTVVTSVTKRSDKLFNVGFSRHGKTDIATARSVVIASGGLPIPKLGASDFALKIAQQFNLHVVPTTPALVPLTITGKDADWFSALAGNSIFSRVSNDIISFEESILFTHWGLSGPAILQISSYWQPGESIHINLLPHIDIMHVIQEERGRGGKRLLLNILQDHFTKKFAEALGKFLPIDKKIASMSKQEAKEVHRVIHHFVVKPAGTKGYDKAEVMKGGVDTQELSSKTLEAKKVSGLFFGGECLDVTGWLGGYNFQWAWASAYIIAQHI
ncbi:NAD(P)/FAD-dependent oxidoreductase [Olivibacter sp. SDN3]|uniref:NAD(P)/FAD-dependent oxidoreductase n=1 Tax=Olivibacter sp. SDN3 TaxID=2764720 RepID=UPI00165193EB|nr:NAD(P)/FAD-dependent oxidoreductase [Olivibacter sp. SDN3]QNL48599.1 NAD(P)/FAD-dependent oxidoreductase [Olivibacter sp. SDN3]